MSVIARWMFIFFGIASFFCASLLPGVEYQPDDYVEGEVLVKYSRPVTIQEIRKSAGDASLTIVTEYPTISKLLGGYYCLIRSSKKSTKELKKSLLEDSNVLVVAPNSLCKPTLIPNDARFNELWGLYNTGQRILGITGTPGADTDAIIAWDTQTGSSDVVVAVIDTGIDYTHEDLAANMWVNPGEVPGDGIDNDGNGFVDDYYGYDFACDSSGNNDSDPMDIGSHGTHVAGIIGAVGNNSLGVTGVCWNIKLMALKASRPDAVLPYADIIEAMDYLLKMKTQFGVNVVAVNASYGGKTLHPIEYDGVKALARAGIIFCASAGNDSTNCETQAFYPANLQSPNLLCVAASDQKDELADFSNYSRNLVHLAAPGVNIVSTVPYGFSPEASVIVNSITYEAFTMEYAGRTGPEGLTKPMYYCNRGLSSTDFPSGVNDYIALIERGDITFREKTQNAMNAGASGVIIFNNREGAVIGTLQREGNWVPAVSISQEDGLTLKALVESGPVLATIKNPLSTTIYSPKNGTSMAAPFVSGTVALLASQYPDDSMATRMNRILSGVEHLPHLVDKVSTGGRLNIARSLDPNLTLNPFVERVEPETGVYPGKILRIIGQEFGETTGSVLFTNETGAEFPAEIISWSNTEIAAKVPSGATRFLFVRRAENRKVQGGDSNRKSVSAWVFKKPTTYFRDNMAAVGYNGKIYVFGGWNANREEVYDPATDSWTAIATMPTQRAKLAAAELNGKIYCVGGYHNTGSGWTDVATVEVYDPETNTWQRKNDLPAVRAWMGLVNMTGCLYMVGGYSYGYSNALYRYNAVQDSWIQLASMNTRRIMHATVALNNKIYVFGGHDGYGVLRSGEVYDPVANIWLPIADMPFPLLGASAVTDGQYIYLIGGSSTGFWEGARHNILKYDPAQNIWHYDLSSIERPLNQVMSGAAVYLPGRGIYRVNGYNDEVYLKDLEFLRMAPSVSVNPTAHNFGEVIDNDSVSHMFVVNNEGSRNLNVGTLSISGNHAASFTIRNDTVSGMTIPPGESKTFEVVFSPVVFSENTAKILIPTDDPDNPSVEISLFGVGRKKGDINKDGGVDISDVILCLRMAIGLDPVNLTISDMNSDSLIDISDVILILRKAIGLD